MTTMQDMLTLLTERESDRCCANLEESIRIREANNKVTAATEELMELKRSQEQEIQVLKVKCDKRYRDTALQCRQQVQKAEKEKAKAEGALESAERNTKVAEARVAAMEQKVHDLKEQLRQRTEEAERRVAAAQRLMEVRLDQAYVQQDRRVLNMADHTKVVMEQASTAIEAAEEEYQEQLAHAHVRAEGRTRFKELCGIAKATNNYEVAQPVYKDIKDELVALWHVQSRTDGSPVAALAPKETNRSLTAETEILLGATERPSLTGMSSARSVPRRRDTNNSTHVTSLLSGARTENSFAALPVGNAIVGS